MIDIDDKDVREACERVSIAVAERDESKALEVCDLLTELFRAGYRLAGK